MDEIKQKHSVPSGKVYDLDHESMIIWPLTNGPAGGLVINNKKIKQGLELGILTRRERMFDTQPKVVNRVLYAKLLDMCDVSGSTVKRVYSAQEEKDGVV